MKGRVFGSSPVIEISLILSFLIPSDCRGTKDEVAALSPGTAAQAAWLAARSVSSA